MDIAATLEGLNSAGNVLTRGREYLRNTCGPEYTVPENLERLRRRSLTKKRRLA